MQTQLESTRDDWESFRAANARRRAIRHFDGSALPEDELRALVAEASLAPASGNMQAYQFHWVRTADKHAQLVAACRDQRAARSAGTLLVLVAHARIGLSALNTLEAQLAALPLASQAHHGELLRKFRLLLRVGGWPLWGPLHALISLLFPALTLLPIGASASRHWLARNSLFAAQTLMLAASARGLDSCPMEGFDARRVAKLLTLPRGAVVSLVIALGRRSEEARVEPRWRKPLSDTLVIH